MTLDAIARWTLPALLLLSAACGSSAKPGMDAGAEPPAEGGGPDTPLGSDSAGTDTSPGGDARADAPAPGDGARPDDAAPGADAGLARTCPIAPAGEMTASLAGTWTFTPSGAAATTIEVPGGGWLAQGFRINAARYERMAPIPSLGRPQATFIDFGVVNHRAALAVDGTMIATNTTSFTPSVFEVTGAVTPGNQHRVTVDVTGRDGLRSSRGKKLVPDAAGWSSNIPQGIFRSATVRAVLELHVSDAFVRTDVAADRLSVDVWVRNSGRAAASGTLQVALSSWSCDALAYPTLAATPVSVPAGQTVKVTVGPVPWGLGPASYWWPNVPYVSGYRAKLHVAAVTVSGPGGSTHTRPVRFGFRQIRQVGTHYELNGVRVNFRGDNLQGANYDSINTGKGPSDGYDLLPGFLPPSAGSPGWPRAVDNYQRLNYDVNRIHQEPASPYMLDVADEMGFMIIDETAIRGTNNDEDFIDGLANMLGHATALVVRDRNHPAVIRWSQANEPEYESTHSTMFELQLYQAIMAADDTRPVSADSGYNGANYDRGFVLVTASNFSVYGHYPGGLGTYTEQVMASATRPFGVGEFVWPKDQTAQGLAWFATGTMAMRRQDASEIRPYTLLSGWSSFVPGTRTPTMVLEPNYPPDGMIHHPLYGEDNLPDPWANPIITRLQRGMNPVLVADLAYWNANRMSDASGAWPAVSETVARGARLSRQLMVFNDTFAGTAVDLAWEMRADSPGGPIADQGTMSLQIPLGQRSTVTIMVTTPATGTRAFLILQSSKDGKVIFREDAQVFQLQ